MKKVLFAFALMTSTLLLSGCVVEPAPYYHPHYYCCWR
jgi:PBP1b-binding outer membrane lipoprotein LpoB